MIPKIIITVIIITSYLNTNISIYKYSNSTDNNNNNSISTIKWNHPIIIKKEKSIATVYIPKINLQENLYSKQSKLNTVERGVTFLPESDLPDKENSLVVIAAHSGNGKIAYFKNLDYLRNDDVINIRYNENIYDYIVTSILIQDKSGKINFSIDPGKRHLILTTCMPHQQGKQLIIIAKEREPN